jgi:hypothetical protein
MNVLAQLDGLRLRPARESKYAQERMEKDGINDLSSHFETLPPRESI